MMSKGGLNRLSTWFDLEVWTEFVIETGSVQFQASEGTVQSSSRACMLSEEVLEAMLRFRTESRM